MNSRKTRELFRRHFMADESLWSRPRAIHPSQGEAVWRLVLYLRFYTYGNAEQQAGNLTLVRRIYATDVLVSNLPLTNACSINPPVVILLNDT